MIARWLVAAAFCLFTAQGEVSLSEAAPYHFAAVEYPGSFETRVYDINIRGDMVGAYDATQGFLYRDGVFTSLDMDSAFIVSPRAINDLGMIAGFYKVRKGCSWEHHGFLLDGEETTLLDFPSFRPPFRGPHRRTYPLGLNNEGQVVGAFSGPGAGKTRSFIYEEGRFGALTPFERRGWNYYGDINDEGRVAGYASRYGGYFYDGDVFWLINPAYHVFPSGINNLDQVVGHYYARGDRKAHGFIYDGGEFITIDHPEALATFISGINDEGRIVGWYEDGFGIHGFSADRVPLPGTAWLLGSALVSLAALRRGFHRRRPKLSQSRSHGAV